MKSAQRSIAVLISGNGSNLQALIDAGPASHYAISAVISNRPGAFGLQRAERHRIPTRVLDHKSFASRDAFDEALGDVIDDTGAELIILAGFMRILGRDFVNRFAGRILNIHPSLLPRYPGANTHQRVLEAGEREHGVSVHFVTEELDGGPVIAQETVPVLKDDTVETLTARVLEKEHLIYPRVVDWFAGGRLVMKDGKAFLDGEEILPAK